MRHYLLRATLARVLGKSGILMSQELSGTAQQVIAAVRAAQLEGVVARRKGSVYVPAERTAYMRAERFKRLQQLWRRYLWRR